jgi:hypothetical protein
MTSPLLLVTEIPVAPDAVEPALALLRARPSAEAAVLYRGVEAPTVLELAPLAGLAQLDERRADWRALAADLAPLSSGDVRRQLLEFVEAPKPVEGELPETPYVQLRHVEVKPPVKEEYLEWRIDTIFAEVHKSDLIEAFLAYHSLLSNEPGVMFVSGFSCEPEKYLPTFASARYAEIARQAHPHFVTDDGLYTRVYRRADS